MDNDADPVAGFNYTHGHELDEELAKDIIREYQDDFAEYYAVILTKPNLPKSFKSFASYTEDEEFKSLREDIMKRWLARRPQGKELNITRYNFITKSLNL